MSEPSIINLLIIDHSKSDIEFVVKTLREDGHQLEITEAAKTEEVRNAIDYQPLDLVLPRLADGFLPLAEVRTLVAGSEQAISIIAMVDEKHRPAYQPARLLDEGADNFFYLEDADHLRAVVRKELTHLRARKQGQSFETRYKESENRTQALLENTQEAIAYIHEGVHIYANPAYLRLFNYQRKEDLAQIQLVHMVPPAYRAALKSVMRTSIRSGKAVQPVELVGVRSNGQTLPILLECAPTRMNDEPCTQIIVRDAAPEKQVYNQQLEELLRYDNATGLYNRRFFLETLEIGHDGSILYVLFTDYAAIRYAIGFEAVDHFVHEAANLIKSLLSFEDIAAHFASGVFAVFLPAGSPTNPIVIAERICAAIAEHTFQIAGKMFTTTCCIGVYKAKNGEESAMQILSNADRACEMARQKGGNQVEIYTPPKQEKKGGISPQDEAVIRQIRDALTKGGLSLSYQPIVSFENAEEARYKVYLHILDEAGGTPQPVDKLSAVAVRYGAMGALDKWAIIRGLSILMEVQKVGVNPPILFVRVSHNSILDKEFFDWIGKRVKDSRLPGKHLVLEIKEEDAEEYFEEAKLLRSRLRDLGCGVALSHFGGRPHSDRLLKEMMPDYIKIDGSLIERLTKTKDENSRRAMATMLTEQAQELRVRVVAAGVATAPQMASIWQFGVTLVQGSMVAEPGPGLDFDFRQYAG
ncbi:MAG: EAL domain-containing protein [Candidatus Competibacteraceae bacterium]|nr:EAL domain-containing protein [Candidatus Competibacteraceae bacterium]